MSFICKSKRLPPNAGFLWTQGHQNLYSWFLLQFLPALFGPAGPFQRQHQPFPALEEQPWILVMSPEDGSEGDRGERLSSASFLMVSSLQRVSNFQEQGLVPVQDDNVKRLSTSGNTIFNCSFTLEFSRVDAHL